MPAESPEVAEGITGNINPGSISVPYTSADISVSSSAYIIFDLPWFWIKLLQSPSFLFTESKFPKQREHLEWKIWQMSAI